ncbi:MAG: hypothetical protein ACK53T_00195 [Planctomycetota bacterium]|jgi:hypothetical protein
MSDFQINDRLVSNLNAAHTDPWVWRVITPDIEGTGDMLLHCDNYGYAAIKAHDVPNWRKIEPIQVFEFRPPKPGEKWLGCVASAYDYLANGGRWASRDVHDSPTVNEPRFVFVEERY